MSKDFLKDVRDEYDVVVIGSGLAGLTAANTLARAGHSVLLLEHHYQLGGMATWFKRQNGHIFDISLHGFPYGMIKSCRKYWTREIADSIVQLKGVRFENPQFSLQTTFDRQDFTRLLIERFGIAPEVVARFFDTARGMNFYDDQSKTVRELFDEFFPGRDDVVRLLMEPITYANGSTLEDPAITYGIVFSNFMQNGVYTFEGGTDRLIGQIRDELVKNGVDVRIRCLVEKIEVDSCRRATGLIVNGRRIGAGPSFPTPISKPPSSSWSGPSTSTRVSSRRRGPCGSTTAAARSTWRSSRASASSRAAISCSTRSTAASTSTPCSAATSAAGPSPFITRTRVPAATVLWSSRRPTPTTPTGPRSPKKSTPPRSTTLSRQRSTASSAYVPGIREKIDHMEASTPRTFEHYTRHQQGASFGTKFEGLKVSKQLPEQVAGLFHSGSVGIIMSGWLGAMNYGVIVANEVDKYLTPAVASV